jgi:hypothetical protein
MGRRSNRAPTNGAQADALRSGRGCWCIDSIDRPRRRAAISPQFVRVRLGGLSDLGAASRTIEQPGVGEDGIE